MVRRFCQKCSHVMHRHGSTKQGPRWKCSHCGATENGRLEGAERKRLNKGANTLAFVAEVMRGHEPKAVRKHLGMSEAGYEAQLAALVRLVRSHYRKRRPSVEPQHWWLMSLHGFEIAVARTRGKDRFRVVTFLSGHRARQVLMLAKVLDQPSEQPVPVIADEWLRRLLDGSLGEPELRARLWLILGRSNAYPFK